MCYFRNISSASVVSKGFARFTQAAIKVTVNVFWVKISIFRFRHILLAELSRRTMIPCLKPTVVSKMEEI